MKNAGNHLPFISGSPSPNNGLKVNTPMKEAPRLIIYTRASEVGIQYEK